MDIYGYRFGKGEKAACIVGAMRGNEILVIPHVNDYSINIGKRFWPGDNTDINRMFPGNEEGETTKRIAAGLFEKVKGYSYGIQFPSFYMPGDFVPHVRMMEAGMESASLANLFGLPYVVMRSPRPYDKATLNYNWQQWNTHAFSIYTGACDQVDESSAKQAVSAVLRFLTRMGILRYTSHSGYIASVVVEQDLTSVCSDNAGIYRRYFKPGDEVKRGEVLADVISPDDGSVISQIHSPTEGTIFFACGQPLIMEGTLLYRIIRRLHQ